MSALGPFELLEELGKGGMGIVYRARQAHLDREIALKLIRERAAGDRELLRRFRREAATLSRLTHPNIVRLLDFGVHEGHYFLAMELIDGIGVDQLIRVRPAEALRLADTIVLAMLDALAAVHESGLVHRDLKPGNIMIRRDGAPLLTDFGLVRDVGKEVTEITEEGLLVGTPSFVPPECFAGEDAGTAADMWALGCVYFNLVSGSEPFDRPTLKETIEAVVRGDVPDLVSRCPGLDLSRRDFLASLLRMDPEERVQDGIQGHEHFAAILAAGKGETRTRRTRALLLPAKELDPRSSSASLARVAPAPAPRSRSRSAGLLLTLVLAATVMFVTRSRRASVPVVSSPTPVIAAPAPVSASPDDRVLHAYARLQKIWPGFELTDIHREYAAIARLVDERARETRSRELFSRIGRSVPPPVAGKLRELRYLRPQVCARWGFPGDSTPLDELEADVDGVVNSQLDALSDWTYLRINLDGLERVSRHLSIRRTSGSSSGPSLEELRMLALNLIFADPLLMDEHGVEILEMLTIPRRDRIILDDSLHDPALSRAKGVELDRRMRAIHARRVARSVTPDPRHPAAHIGLKAYMKLEELVPGFHPPSVIERFLEVSRETDPALQEEKAGELLRFLGRRMSPGSARAVVDRGYLSPALVQRWELPVTLTSKPIGENESDPFRLMVSDSIESMKDVTYITLNIEAFEKTVLALTQMVEGAPVPAGLGLTDLKNFLFHLFLIDPPLLDRRGKDLCDIVDIPRGTGPSPVLDVRGFDPAILSPRLRGILTTLRDHYRPGPAAPPD